MKIELMPVHAVLVSTVTHCDAPVVLVNVYAS
jgi:hypothetical protein